MRIPTVLAFALAFAGAPLALAQQQEPPNPFGDPLPSDPPAADGPGNVFVDRSPPVTPECAAPCPAGTSCIQGRCTSLCQPPCPAGQHCGSNGICVGAPTTGVHAAPGIRAPLVRPEPREPISGSAAVVRGGVAMGMAALSLGFGLGAWATERDDPDAVAPLVLTGLGAASVFSGVFVALGGSREVRAEGGATGIPFLRVTTWIFFGATMLLDIVAIAGSAALDGETLENAHLAGGIAGAFALLSAGAEALTAGLQQNKLRRTYEEARQALRWVPRLGRMHDLSGATVPALGWSGAF